MDKIRLSYMQTGRAIWISHLDMMRMLQRAMNRANIPIKYSEGFNPHAMISILLPLSVGTESYCQLADIRVREDVDPATLPGRLNAVMPEGIEVTDAWEEGSKAAELQRLRALCRWEYDGPAAEKLPALRALFEREQLIVQRRTKRGEGPFDLLPHTRILSMEAEGNAVLVSCELSAAEPVVKPELLGKAVEENAPDLAPRAARCRRVRMLKKDGTEFR